MNEGNGLHFMRARYYRPGLGRFISPDPLGLDGGDREPLPLCRQQSRSVDRSDWACTSTLSATRLSLGAGVRRVSRRWTVRCHRRVESTPGIEQLSASAVSQRWCRIAGYSCRIGRIGTSGHPAVVQVTTGKSCLKEATGLMGIRKFPEHWRLQTGHATTCISHAIAAAHRLRTAR